MSAQVQPAPLVHVEGMHRESVDAVQDILTPTLEVSIVLFKEYLGRESRVYNARRQLRVPGRPCEEGPVEVSLKDDRKKTD